MNRDNKDKVGVYEKLAIKYKRCLIWCYMTHLVVLELTGGKKEKQILISFAQIQHCDTFWFCDKTLDTLG